MGFCPENCFAAVAAVVGVPHQQHSGRADKTALSNISSKITRKPVPTRRVECVLRTHPGRSISLRPRMWKRLASGTFSSVPRDSRIHHQQQGEQLSYVTSIQRPRESPAGLNVNNPGWQPGDKHHPVPTRRVECVLRTSHPHLSSKIISN